MLSALRAEALLENTAAEFAARPDWRPLTRFETRGVARGHAVYYLLFRRR
jgi:tRNA (guanine-N7-)-methyltransferase